MSKKYYCETCNYSSDRQFDYKRHMKSKKHINNTTQNIVIIKDDPLSLKDDPSSLKDVKLPSSKSRVCEYCERIIAHKNNMARHYKKCIKYAEHKAKIEKDNVINQLKTQLKEKDINMEELYKKLKKKEEKLKKKQAELEDLRDVERDFLEFMKKASVSQSSVTNINNYNMFFIVKTYIDAMNYEDRMSKPLTAEEKEYVLENGGVYGGYYIIYERCIKGVELKDRPFHCVDRARSKYMLRTGDAWQIDEKGKKILEGIYPRMLKLCCPQQIKSPDELDTWKKHNDYMVELSKNGEGKILKMLNEVSLLKNNIAIE